MVVTFIQAPLLDCFAAEPAGSDDSQKTASTRLRALIHHFPINVIASLPVR